MNQQDILTVVLVFRNGIECKHIYNKIEFNDEEIKKVYTGIIEEFSKERNGLLVLDKPTAIYKLEDVVAVRFEGSVVKQIKTPAIGYLAAIK